MLFEALNILTDSNVIFDSELKLILDVIFLKLGLTLHPIFHESVPVLNVHL